MEEQKMNEKESLELIAQMIRVTKQSIGSGCRSLSMLWFTLRETVRGVPGGS